MTRLNILDKRAVFLCCLLVFPLQLLRLGDAFPMTTALIGIVSAVAMYYFSVHRPIPLLAAGAMIAYDYVIFSNAQTWLPPYAIEMFIGWVAAILLIVTSHTTKKDITAMVDISTPDNVRYYLLIGAITVFGAVLRIYNFKEIPVLNGDEAFITLFGMTYFDGTFANPFISGWLELPSMLLFIPGLAVQFFGQTVLSLRLANLILGVLAIPLCIWAVRPMLNRPYALVAGFALATLGLHINFSRNNYIIIYDMMCALAILGLMLRSEKGFLLRDIVLIGVIIGIGQFGYASARSLALLMIIWTGLQIIRLPAQWKTSLYHLVLCGTVTIAVAGPLLLHYYKQPDNFRAPLQRASLILPDSPDGSSVLSRQMKEFNKSGTEIIAENLRKSFTAIITGPVDGWYRSNSAILPPLYALFFVIGLLVSLWNWRSTRSNILLVNIFFVCMTASLSYPVAAGHRMVSMLGSVTLLIGLGAQTIAMLILRFTSAKIAHTITTYVLAAMVALGAYQSVYHYFYVFMTVENGTGDPAMQSIAAFVHYAQKLPPGTPVDVYETDYLNQTASGIMPFLTKHIDYRAIPAGERPRANAQVVVIPFEHSGDGIMPDGFRVFDVKTNFEEPMLQIAIAPSLAIDP